MVFDVSRQTMILYKFHLPVKVKRRLCMPANMAQGNRRRAVRLCQGPNSPISVNIASKSMIKDNKRINFLKCGFKAMVVSHTESMCMAN